MKRPLAAAVAVSIALTGCATKQDARVSSVTPCDQSSASNQAPPAGGPVPCQGNGSGGTQVSQAPEPTAPQSEFERAMTGLGIVLLAGAIVVALILLPLAFAH